MMKFGVVGISGIAVNMLTLWFLKQVTHAPVLLAGGIAIEISILNNFAWNYQWTFMDRQAARREGCWRALLKYHLAVSLAALTNFFLLWLLHEYMHVHYLIANACGIAIGVLINYSFSNLWVFKG